MILEFNTNPSKQKLTDFAGGMSLLSLLFIPLSIFLLSDSGWTWVPLTTLGTLAFVWFITCRFLNPSLIKPFYLFWMGSSFLISLIVGPLLLAAIYFLILTPTAFISKLTGKKWLPTKSKESYWTPLPPHDKKHSEKMF